MRWVWLSLVLLLGGCHFLERSENRFGLSGYDERQIRHRTSKYEIDLTELEYWDTQVEKLVTEKAFSLAQTARLYAYLYCAQKAFADASFDLTTSYTGSVDLISAAVIKLFIPNYSPIGLKIDAFSKELTEGLMRKIQARFDREQKGIQSINVKSDPDSWQHASPVETDAPTMKPWGMKRADAFSADPPPEVDSSAWSDQLEQVKRGTEGATGYQKERSYFWSKMHTPQESDWRYIAAQYMKEQKVSIEMFMVVRAKVAMAIMDGFIAVFHDKYTYMVKRPDMRDETLKTLFPNPQHPSYPSGHSTISSAAATVLLYYFPENANRWRYLAEEAGQSRLWAGIHYPIDLQAGKKQGVEVGKAVIFSGP